MNCNEYNYIVNLTQRLWQSYIQDAKVGLVAYIGNKRYQFTVQTESWCFAYTQFRFFVKQRNTLHVHVAYLKILFDLIVW